jgi:hypothetical protein
MVAFGPIFDSTDHAEDFLKWLKGIDPRTLTEKDLLIQFGEWCTERLDEDGNLRDEMAEALAYEEAKSKAKGEDEES